MPPVQRFFMQSEAASHINHTWKYVELVHDPLIKNHLGKLYERLLESNLIKIIQPFSCVEIEHVAKLINLPSKQIEIK